MTPSGTGDQFEADLQVTQFQRVAGSTSVLGPLERFRLVVKGAARAGQLKLDGYIAEQPQMRITMELAKRAEL